MNFATIMQGKLTKRAAYAFMLAGVYLISYQVADFLDAAATVETRHLIAALLRGEGFKLLLGGIGLYGLRRAIDSGLLREDKEKPLTPEEQEARLRELLLEAQTIVKQSKGN